MRFRKLCIVLCLSLLFLAAVEVSLTRSEDTVTKGKNEMAVADQWTELIVAAINAEQIHLQVDGREIVLGVEQAFMDRNQNLMISSRILTDAFSCSTRLFSGRKLVIEKNDVELVLNEGLTQMLVNGEPLVLESPPVIQDENFYLPVEALEKGFGYTYEWRSQEYLAVFQAKSQALPELPPAYDYREKGRMPSVRDQGTLGTCWAFASLSAMESALIPEERLDFSEDHMTLHHSFSTGRDDGGDYTMSMAYLAAWQGPVLEKDDPYNDGRSPGGLAAVKHVQEIRMIESKDFKAIKRAVYFYGGVQSSLYLSLQDYRSKSIYYNSENSAYCYIGNEKINHEVVIVGWDDYYPKENFNNEVPGDGAFICLNSWGTYFGDGGVFYVSYYDTNIGIHNLVYTGVEESDNYDHIYQSDLCGWTGQMGYGIDTAWFANIYEAGGDEILEAAGFYATGSDSRYMVYVAEDVDNDLDFLKRHLVAQGELEDAGYYTIKFDEPVDLKKGERFAVIVKLTTPGSVHPIAIEYEVAKNADTVVLDDGEGYISARGSIWTSAEKSQECNICLKAFTSDRRDFIFTGVKKESRGKEGELRN